MNNNDFTFNSPQESRGLAITSLVLGILAFFLIVLVPLGGLLGIAAIVCGVIALYKKQPKAMAIIGTVGGAVSVALTVLLVILLVVFLTAFYQTVESYGITPEQLQQIMEGKEINGYGSDLFDKLIRETLGIEN